MLARARLGTRPDSRSWPGWCYSTLAQLNFAADSWTTPLDALRLDPHPQAAGINQVAATQIRALLARLGGIGPVPWFVFNGGYDPVQLSVELAGAQAQLLVRIKSDRVFRLSPGPGEPGRPGPPRRHGAKFRCADAASWPEPHRCPSQRQSAVRDGDRGRLARPAPDAAHLPGAERSDDDRARHPGAGAPRAACRGGSSGRPRACGWGGLGPRAPSASWMLPRRRTSVDSMWITPTGSQSSSSAG